MGKAARNRRIDYWVGSGSAGRRLRRLGWNGRFSNGLREFKAKQPEHVIVNIVVKGDG